MDAGAMLWSREDMRKEQLGGRGRSKVLLCEVEGTRETSELRCQGCSWTAASRPQRTGEGWIYTWGSHLRVDLGRPVRRNDEVLGGRYGQGEGQDPALGHTDVRGLAQRKTSNRDLKEQPERGGKLEEWASRSQEE